MKRTLLKETNPILNNFFTVTAHCPARKVTDITYLSTAALEWFCRFLLLVKSLKQEEMNKDNHPNVRHY